MAEVPHTVTVHVSMDDARLLGLIRQAVRQRRPADSLLSLLPNTVPPPSLAARLLAWIRRRWS